MRGWRRRAYRGYRGLQGAGRGPTASATGAKATSCCRHEPYDWLRRQGLSTGAPLTGPDREHEVNSMCVLCLEVLTCREPVQRRTIVMCFAEQSGHEPFCGYPRATKVSITVILFMRLQRLPNSSATWTLHVPIRTEYDGSDSRAAHKWLVTKCELPAKLPRDNTKMQPLPFPVGDKAR
ncbi:hypothetical protein BBK36DRAFT_1138844 [Trichoderma citrinoviride]|uniref:Uncharacterized protein n=1 Tax=Trichoderma citrinoviride TaxID=58853 RepID=A0A2T4BHE8_9HYPO|nr:hypothetical protein BBK36DRAFT_1138844 [Trichoderma citrinoviride]PTB68746.1 hypothetical protein BBK36DRAFT_1138844 [Trichoderma citrinoviride]